MNSREKIPERLETSVFSAWGDEGAQLEADLPAIIEPADRWLQLILLTNVLHSQFEIVKMQMDEAMAELAGISDPDDPELPIVEEFVEWAQGWSTEFQSRFDRYRDEREAVASGLTENVREAVERKIDGRFDEIKDRIKAQLQSNLRKLEAQALSDSGLKVCPDCAEEVKMAARKCRFCGYRFDSGSPA